MSEQEIDFLEQSNFIEGVYDEVSLDQAVLAWEYLMEQEEMSPEVVKKTHEILMLYKLRGCECGHFRTVDVWVGRHKGEDPKNIPQLVKAWCEEMNLSPENWKSLHVAYESVHPFTDGNGRTGRMFMNWHRIKKCGLPLLVIKEEERQEYYKWFRGKEDE